MLPRWPVLLAADSPGPGKLWTKAPVFGKPLFTGFCTPSATPMSWALAKAADVPPMTISTASAETTVLRVYVIDRFLSLFGSQLPARDISLREAWNMQQDGAPTDLVSPRQHGARGTVGARSIGAGNPADLHP